MREIEVKLRVKDVAALERALAERGCALSAPISQYDRIYSEGDTSIWTDAREGDCALRIRNQDGKYILNLKQQQSAEHDNLEYETVVAEGEVMHQILAKMGWTPIVEVKKMRRIGKFGTYEICVDQVEELGTFAELEKMCEDDADPEAVFTELLKEMESLGLPRSEQEHKGYDTQVFHKQHPDASQNQK